VNEVDPVSASEECLRIDERRFRIVSVIAGIAYAPFVLGHAAFALFAVPVFGQMYADMGGELPAVTQLLVNLSRFGLLAALLVAVDVAVFAFMYRLAKRYWIGLLFVPLAIAPAMAYLFLPALYLPMFDVIQRVQ